jgi:hypothetical protein
MRIKKYRFKLSGDVTFPTLPKYVLGVRKVAEVRDENGDIIDEEYEITVLE